MMTDASPPATTTDVHPVPMPASPYIGAHHRLVMTWAVDARQMHPRKARAVQARMDVLALLLDAPDGLTLAEIGRALRRTDGVVLGQLDALTWEVDCLAETDGDPVLRHTGGRRLILLPEPGEPVVWHVGRAFESYHLARRNHGAAGGDTLPRPGWPPACRTSADLPAWADGLI